MLFAILEIVDYAVIAGLILVLAGGGAAASAYRRPAERDRLQRIEDKLDLVLDHLGVEYTAPPKVEWQELADDPARKIEAIKVYREEHGVGLAEAKAAVEAYIDGRNR
jgi:ribosomal protein L7/L12